MAFIPDGFKTTITAGVGDLSIVLHEKEVQPPALDAAGPIDTTTMRNNTMRTFNPKKLVTLAEMTLQCGYDTVSYNTIYASFLGVNMSWAVNFPDGKVLTFWGWLDKFTPTGLKEGEFPLAEVKIVPSNHDNAGVEVAPVLV